MARGVPCYFWPSFPTLNPITIRAADGEGPILTRPATTSSRAITSITRGGTSAGGNDGIEVKTGRHHSASHSQVPQVRDVTSANNTIYLHSACLSIGWPGATGMTLGNNAVYGTGASALRARAAPATAVGGRVTEPA
jgi:hypothetical protein